MTFTKPAAGYSQSTDISVRRYGSSQTEDRKREQLRKYTETLRAMFAQRSMMWTSVVVTEISKTDPDFKTTLGKTKFSAFLELSPERFKLQTSSSGGQAWSCLFVHRTSSISCLISKCPSPGNSPICEQAARAFALHP